MVIILQWIFWVGPLIGATGAALYHRYVMRGEAAKALLSSFPSTAPALMSSYVQEHRIGAATAQTYLIYQPAIYEYIEAALIWLFGSSNVE